MSIDIAKPTVLPAHRLRRLRRTPTLRRMVQETRLNIEDFIYPLFVMHGSKEKREIPSMPGVYQWSLDMLQTEIEEVARLGIPSVLLFGLPASKDPVGSEAYAANGIIQQATRLIKHTVPEMIVITDLCLCEYTSHGHCGVIEDGCVQNDQTLGLLARTAVSQAGAGADIIAPSDMMDGRVAAIREALDANDMEMVPIFAYAAKFASAFYGPFRDAADSAPQFGDRRSYQMDPPNAREALREVEADIKEGADMVMVKPALPYLDIIARVRQMTNLPVGAYNVSGEYSMLKAAARNGWLEERRAAMEMLTAIKRAGADLIISYWAKDLAGWLREE